MDSEGQQTFRFEILADSIAEPSGTGGANASNDSNQSNRSDVMKKYLVYMELPKIKIGDYRKSSCVSGNVIRFHFLLRIARNESETLRLLPIRAYKTPVVNFAVIHRPFLDDDDARGPIPKSPSVRSPLLRYDDDQSPGADTHTDDNLAEDFRRDNAPDKAADSWESQGSKQPEEQPRRLSLDKEQALVKPPRRPSQASAGKSAEQPDEKPQRRPSQASVGKSAEQSDEKPQKRPSQASVGKSAEQPDEKPQRRPSQASVGKSAEQPDEKPQRRPSQASVGKSAEQPDEKPQRRPSQASVGKPPGFEVESGQRRPSTDSSKDPEAAAQQQKTPSAEDEAPKPADNQQQLEVESPMQRDRDLSPAQNVLSDDHATVRTNDATAQTRRKQRRPKKYFVYCEIPKVLVGDYRNSSVICSEIIHAHFLLKIARDEENGQPRLQPVRRYHRPKVNFAVIHRSLLVDDDAIGPIPRSPNVKSPMIREDQDDDDDDEGEAKLGPTAPREESVLHATMGFCYGRLPRSKYELVTQWSLTASGVDGSNGRPIPELVLSKAEA